MPFFVVKMTKKSLISVLTKMSGREYNICINCKRFKALCDKILRRKIL